MAKFGLEAGSRIRIFTKTSTYEGIIMPRPELASKEFVTLKLDSGYNIGVLKNSILKVEKLAKSEKATPKSELKFEAGKPPISLITTGGTITSKVDYQTGGVRTVKEPAELIEGIPEIAKFVNITDVIQPFALMSEDMGPKEWQKLAQVTAKELNKDVRGAILTHGTDTLHYTSAALSFMLKNLSKPVAVVGAQRSADRGSTDRVQNLVCAAHYCLSDIAEVSIVMHGETDDEYCIATRGTKVRKMHASRRDAFRPVNDIPFAKIFPDGNIVVTNPNHKTRSASKVTADTAFEEKVALVQVFPGADPGILDYYVSKKYKGIVISGTGLGHVPTQPFDKKMSWIPGIKRAVDSGIFVGIAPQTLYGRIDLNVYANQRILQDAGAIGLGDMLPETAYVKLGWVLGHTKKFAEDKKLMLTNIAGEFNERIEPNSFLY